MFLWFFGGWNFCPEPPSYLSDELIVSRFSSLSGCLNPKVKAFRPRFISPLPGAFYFSRPLEPLLEPVAAFVDALSRNARKKRHAITTETLMEFAQERGLCRARELVRFGKQGKKWNVAQPVDELLVDRREWMTGVLYDDDADQT